MTQQTINKFLPHPALLSSQSGSLKGEPGRRGGQAKCAGPAERKLTGGSEGEGRSPETVRRPGVAVFIGVGLEQVMFKQCCEEVGWGLGKKIPGETALKSKSSLRWLLPVGGKICGRLR